MTKVVISGYYGFANTGDEAILSVLVEELREHFPQTQIVVLSATPEETSQLHKVRAVHRGNLRHIHQELRSASVFLSGGGGLIQDRTSRRSAFYYLSLMALAMRHCPVIVIGQGIGPIQSRIVRAWAQQLLRGVDCAMVRDERSYKILRDWGLPQERLLLGGDLALLLWPRWKSCREEATRGDEQAYVIVCLKGQLSKRCKSVMAEQLDDLSETQTVKIAFLALHPPEDLQAMQQIASQMKRSCHVFDSRTMSLSEIIQSVASAKVVVGMRLHALIFALLAARPFVALSDDPKIAAFLKQIESANGLKFPCWTVPQLETQEVELTRELNLLLDGYRALRERMIHAAESLYGQTRQSVDAVWQRLAAKCGEAP